MMSESCACSILVYSELKREASGIKYVLELTLFYASGNLLKESSSKMPTIIQSLYNGWKRCIC